MPRSADGLPGEESLSRTITPSLWPVNCCLWIWMKMFVLSPPRRMAAGRGGRKQPWPSGGKIIWNKGSSASMSAQDKQESERRPRGMISHNGPAHLFTIVAGSSPGVSHSIATHEQDLERAGQNLFNLRQMSPDWGALHRTPVQGGPQPCAPVSWTQPAGHMP